MEKPESKPRSFVSQTFLAPSGYVAFKKVKFLPFSIYNPDKKQTTPGGATGSWAVSHTQQCVPKSLPWPQKWRAPYLTSRSFEVLPGSAWYSPSVPSTIRVQFSSDPMRPNENVPVRAVRQEPVFTSVSRKGTSVWPAHTPPGG